MDSVERVKQICKERSIAISKLEKDLGFSNGYIRALRKGVFPQDRLMAIANYLKVSPDYIMTGKKDWQPKLTEKDEKELDKKVENLLNAVDTDTGLPQYLSCEVLHPVFVSMRQTPWMSDTFTFNIVTAPPV